MEMLEIVWPLVLTAAIVIFVILRLKSKFKGRTSDDITREEIVGGYFMPIGLLLGTVYSLFSSIPLITSLGPSIGFLFGYFAYEVYSRKGESTQ